MMFTAAATPSEMLVWPCGGSLAARIANGEANASPSVVAVCEKTVNEHGPLAIATSSEKHSRASWVRRPMLPLLSSTKWNRVGGLLESAGCSASKVKPITQVLLSREARRARASGRPPHSEAVWPNDDARFSIGGGGNSWAQVHSAESQALTTACECERERINVGKAGGGGGKPARMDRPRLMATARPKSTRLSTRPCPMSSPMALQVSVRLPMLAHHELRRCSAALAALPWVEPSTRRGGVVVLATTPWQQS
mmetsp:Transcript_115588/g.288841  ORF Transcript_115588/g.288841 Transcript_115588/m.288841 type:complete len:253 (+) Transcript_115588:2563-3321(+)